ncbi:unnamed protein product [Gadus morhua 'NCC']
MQVPLAVVSRGPGPQEPLGSRPKNSRASSLPLGGVLEAPRGDERAGDTAFSGQNELPVRGASGGLVRRVAGCQAPGHMMDRPGRGSRQEVKREGCYLFKVARVLS